MKNQQLLEEVRDLFESFDKDMDALSVEVANIKGQLEEMKRHNGRVVKVLAGIITSLLAILGGVVAYLLSSI